MKFLKLKINQDVFKFDEIEFTDDLQLTEESKLKLIEYFTPFLEVIEAKSDKEFISIISEQLNINNTTNIGNTIDIHTTNKKIYQMCYLETNIFGKKEDVVKDCKLEEVKDCKPEVDPNLNFLATVCNIKRKPINGDVFIFGNSLLTTQITDPSKTLEYITQVDITIDDLIDIVLSNYYFTGVCFEGNTFNKFIFDNNLKIVAPLTFKDVILSELSFKRSDVLNYTIDVFFDKTGSNAKNKYNVSLGLFYDIVFNNRIFIALKSETEKSYD